MAASCAIASPAAPRIPLCAGLTIVTAVGQPEGDYESIKRIESIDDDVMRLKYSSERAELAGSTVTSIAKTTVQRIVSLADTRDATAYLQIFQAGTPAKVPGATAVGTSSAVLRALKTQGRATMSVFTMLSRGMSADPQVHPSVYDYQVAGELSRIGAVSLPVMVNDSLVNLPALRARADFEGDRAEFYFLDDERNPLALRFRIGIDATAAVTPERRDRDTLDVVRISFDCDAQSPDVLAKPAPSRIEQALARGERIDVYDIFFSFNSDRIREESAPTLAQLGAILRRHPDWRLSIGGHTDNIAGERYNLDLSRRRAAAVKQALVDAQGVVAVRLSIAGYGESAPRDTNDTLEGRARNRRVELARLP